MLFYTVVVVPIGMRLTQTWRFTTSRLCWRCGFSAYSKM